MELLNIKEISKEELFEKVSLYIEENVLHSKVWDSSDMKIKKKALNNSVIVLNNLLSKFYKNGIPVDHVCEQILWILKIDDSIQRSELGITYIQVDGVSMNISEKDRSVAPYILRSLNLPLSYFNRRRTARYSEPHHPYHMGIGRYKC